MEKKSIAVFIRGFHNGGIEKVFENYFSHMDLSQYSVHMVTHMQNDPARKKVFTDMGCVVHELSPLHGHKLTLQNIREYKALFQNNRFDIVHNNMPDNLLPFLFASGEARTKPYRILHAHSKYTDGFKHAGAIKKTLYRMGFERNAGKADLLLAISRESAAAAFFSFAEKAEILPNAIDIPRFTFRQETRERIRRQLGGENRYILGHVGRIESNIKNHRFLIDVIDTLRETDAELFDRTLVLLIGEGEKKSEFEEYAREKGLAEKIRFLGAQDKVQEYLMAMDLFLFPSRQEGLGIAAIEAQATGLPCLISDHVPGEVRMTEDVEFLDIDGPSAKEEWARRIAEQYAKRAGGDREAAAAAVGEKGYNIEEQAERLACIYRNGACRAFHIR